MVPERTNRYRDDNGDGSLLSRLRPHVTTDKDAILKPSGIPPHADIQDELGKIQSALKGLSIQQAELKNEIVAELKK